jgi:rod shape-determining protein MreC
MRFFLRTKKFRVCLSVIAVVLALCIAVRVIGGILSPGAGLWGTIIAPFQQAATYISQAIDNLQKKYNDGNQLLLENQKLKEENDTLRKQNADFDETLRQNEFYKDYLEIKDINPDFTFCDARLVAVDKDDLYHSFVINKGSAHGVKALDPVIIGNSLVGYISKVGLTTSKVTTILSPEIVAGANDSRTGDTGIISGTADFAAEDKLKFYNLTRDCQVAVGDTVITSGEGLFPHGLLIGTVETIKSDSSTSSLYSTVIPFVDFSNIRNVMVITHFEGQGALGSELGE